MAEKIVALQFIAGGLWNALNSKQAVRDHEDFQRYLRPKMRPYNEREIQRSRILTTIFGIVFTILGFAMLFGLLPLSRG